MQVSPASNLETMSVCLLLACISMARIVLLVRIRTALKLQEKTHSVVRWSERVVSCTVRLRDEHEARQTLEPQHRYDNPSRPSRRALCASAAFHALHAFVSVVTWVAAAKGPCCTTYISRQRALLSTPSHHHKRQHHPITGFGRIYRRFM